MVRFENVGLRYGMGPEVLHDVSFHLEPGSLHFLTGPSGAGKTSLLRLLFLALRERLRLRGHGGVCEYRRVCGGCRARAYAVSGQVFGEEPYCTHEPAKSRAPRP